MQPRSSLAFVAIAGCNWVYGLGDVRSTDAQVFDARPSTCPPSGTLPVYDHSDLRVIVPQDCIDYTRSAGNERALAYCNGEIYEGAPDQLLTPAVGDFDAALDTQPRISSDGKFATMRRSVGGVDDDLLLLHRDDAGWVRIATIASGHYDSISEPTDEPRHVLVATLGMVIELADDGFAWLPVGSMIPLPTFGLAVHLSPDGLRMWFAYANDFVEYWDRPSITGEFHRVGMLANTTNFHEPYITPDCGRLYFRSLNGVWFAHQAQ